MKHATNRASLFKVRRNLYNFLVMAAGSCNDFRESDTGPASPTSQLGHLLEPGARDQAQPWFWIDAICIDQFNVAERNHQVRRMGSIYSQAESVLIWLGEEKALNESLITTTKIFPLPHRTSQQASTEQSICSVNAIQSNPYWARLWIVQEIVLAREVFVLRGDGLFLWDVISNPEAILDIFDEREKLDKVWPLNSSILSLLEIRDTYHRGKDRLTKTQPGMDYWLRNFQNSQCSDPRDMVYGLLALVEHGDKFEVDYELSTQDLFLRTMTFLELFHSPRGTAIVPHLLWTLQLDEQTLSAETGNDVCSSSDLTSLAVVLSTPDRYDLDSLVSEDASHADRNRGYVRCPRCRKMLIGAMLERWGLTYAIWCTSLGSDHSYHFVIKSPQNGVAVACGPARAIGLIYIPSCFSSTWNRKPATLVDLHPDINFHAQLATDEAPASIKVCRRTIFRIMLSHWNNDYHQILGETTTTKVVACNPFSDKYMRFVQAAPRRSEYTISRPVLRNEENLRLLKDTDDIECGWTDRKMRKRTRRSLMKTVQLLS